MENTYNLFSLKASATHMLISKHTRSFNFKFWKDSMFTRLMKIQEDFVF